MNRTDNPRSVERQDSLSLTAQKLCVCRPRSAPNFLVNCDTHHRQYLVRNVSHVVHHGDVIRSRGHNLLLGVAMRFELTPRNKIVTVRTLDTVSTPP